MFRRTLLYCCIDGSTRKLQVAVVGSGPSGCYVAHHLLKNSENVHVDVFEKLPVPYGLSRYGVAPDHPEVKNVENTFTKMFESGRASFLGNILIGKEITVEQLLSCYSAVVVSTGAPSDAKLGIPGEDLFNIVSAKKIVDWYNTVPTPHAQPTMCPFPIDHIRNIVVIGNGNVAIDCARVLITPYKHWCPTDMNCQAVKCLMRSVVRNVEIVARRGVEHSAFTTKEFRELTEFEKEVRIVVDEFDVDDKLAKLNTQDPKEKPRKRQMELLHKWRASRPVPTLTKEEEEAQKRQSTGSRVRNAGWGMVLDEKEPLPPLGPGGEDWRKTLRFRYNLKPERFLPKEGDPGSVGGVLFRVNKPAGTTASSEDSGSTPKEDSEDEGPSHVIVPCDMVIRSVGYSVDPFRGVPYDLDAKHFAHDGKGRVDGISRLYCSGWAKRGPKGVILQTMVDAQETAKCILADIDNPDCRPPEGTSNMGKFDLVDRMSDHEIYPVMFSAVKRIWNMEKERGIDLGKRAEKVPHTRDMIDMGMAGKLGVKAEKKFRGIAPSRPPGFELLEDWLDDDTMLIDGDDKTRVHSMFMETSKTPAFHKKLN